jgi:hypothetical protein
MKSDLKYLNIDNIACSFANSEGMKHSDLDALIADKNLEACETSYLYYLKANVYLEHMDLKNALIYIKRSLQMFSDDIGLFNHCMSTLSEISSALLRLGRQNPEDLDIGWVYENIRDLGCIGLDQHILAAYHYQCIGDQSRFQRLMRLIDKIYPNHPQILAIKGHINVIEKTMEVSDEENQNSTKNTVA